MFRFASPVWLAAVALAPLFALLYWRGAAGRRRALERFADSQLVARLTGTLNPRARLVRRALVVCAGALAGLAAAQPQFGTRVETVRREGADIMIALDLSVSMLAEDVSPNRLGRAKLEIQRILGALDGDRAGLVAFGGQAFVQSPLTSDYAAARLFLGAMDTDLMPVQGTDIGAAVQLALEALRNASRQGGQGASTSPANQAQRVIVLITDGEDHEGGVDQAAAMARAAGVEIHAVAIGTESGLPIPEFTASGSRRGFKRDESGAVVTTRVNPGMLESLAVPTGGRVYRSGADGTQLTELLETIQGLRAGEGGDRRVTVFEEQFQVFLGFALLMLMVEGVVPDRRCSRQDHEEWGGGLHDSHGSRDRG